MTNSEKIIKILTVNDPDFKNFYKDLPTEVSQIKDIPPELADDVVSVLREDTSIAKWIDSQENAPQRFAVAETLLGIGTISAIVFLFRFHIKFKKNKDDTWEFLFERKPDDSNLLIEVLNKIEKILNAFK